MKIRYAVLLSLVASGFLLMIAGCRSTSGGNDDRMRGLRLTVLWSPVDNGARIIRPSFPIDSFPLGTHFVSREQRLTPTPLLPVIYFESGVGNIPSRYHTELPGANDNAVTEKELTGDDLARYHHLPDILIERLHTMPEASLQLTGWYLPGEGEAEGVMRANAIVDYLIRVGGINPTRLQRPAPRQFPCGDGDSLCFEDHRRVTIETDHPYLLHSIMADRFITTLLAVPDLAEMRIETGDIPLEEIDAAWIDVMVNGQLFSSIPGMVAADRPFSRRIEWKSGAAEYLPRELADSATLSLRPRLQRKDGRFYDGPSLPLNIVVVPPDYIASSSPLRSCWYSVGLLFEEGKSELSDRQLNELDHLLDLRRMTDTLQVVGYASSDEERSDPWLAVERMKNVVAGLEKRGLQKGLIVPIERSPAVETSVRSYLPTTFLPSEGTPEGRAYHQLVRVTVRKRCEELHPLQDD